MMISLSDYFLKIYIAPLKFCPVFDSRITLLIGAEANWMFLLLIYLLNSRQGMIYTLKEYICFCPRP